MDPNDVASLYTCGVCGKLPMRRAAEKEGEEERPVAAEDGHFYHESCIKREFERAGDGGVISPVTKLPMGEKLIFAKTVQCLLETLSRNVVDQEMLVEASHCATKSVSLIETKKKAEGGSLKHMALLGRWYLLNEVEGTERNATKGFGWCKNAADNGDCDGMAYQAIWMLHGYDEIQKNRNEGFELLVEAANEGSGVCVLFGLLF